MKMKTLIVIIISLLLSCSNNKKKEFLFLNSQQLKLLGIDVNDNGIFYKNSNPNSKKDKKRYCYFAFYCTKNIYLNTIFYSEKETIEPKNKYDSLIINLNLTKNDFYPLLIGNTRGQQSYDGYSVFSQEMKLLPIAICMKESKLAKREDTIVVWLKPTDALRKALPDSLKLDDYLKVPIVQ